MDLYGLIGPVLRLLSPETAHWLTIEALSHGLGPRAEHEDDPILASRVWDLDFPNPVGLAAGFDKDGQVCEAMLGMGFGFVEVGSITPEPQPGNPKPRLFRLTADGGVINRLGFNSRGHAAAVEQMGRRRHGDGIVGVNLGKNRNSTDAGADYARGATLFAGLAEYLVVNVSSPNTPGLRALQGRDELTALLSRVSSAMDTATSGRSPPLLLKIAPDLTPDDRADIAAVVQERGVDGLIVSNTTISRPVDLKSRDRAEAGGLSGRPLFELSTAVLADMYRLTEGRVPLIGVGGISSGADAYAKIRAGASLVQLYTALIYQGPGLVGRIKSELAAALKADGFATVSAAVGADHR